MNKIFKVIWSKAKHCYIVASELAKSHSKSNSSRTIRKSIAALGIALAFYAATGSALAANSGGDLDQNTGDYTGNSQYNYTVTIDSNVDGKVYGRKEDSNTSEKATVTISGDAKISNEVYGGYSESGNAVSNSVNISYGTVYDCVYGGYSDSGNSASNSVNISDGTVNYNVFGGYVEHGSGNATSNSVNISDVTVNGYVFGGFSYRGNVASNSVKISYGTVYDSVYGGYSDSGNSASNSVTINSGNVKGYVYGGYVNTGSGDAASNSVNINGGIVDYDVLGGFSDRGNVASNSVNISDGTVKFNVFGGYVDLGSGNAACNSVNISGGTVNQHVFGGRSYSGNAASNSVSISGDTTNILGNIYGGVASSTGNAYENKVNISSGTVNGEVFGGYSRLGKAASNSVSISGGTVEKAVYGGYVYSSSGIGSDNVSSNSVTISGDLDSTIIKGFVYGGYIGNGTGNVSSNSVNIVGGKVEKDVYGGYSDEDAAASNSVNISGGKVEKDVYGGWSYSNAATCNSVNISNGTIGNNNDDGNVYGGYANSGIKNANSNSINFSGGLVNNLYGGYSKQGNAASNSIIISVGTVNNNVYGGYVETNNGDAASNSVTINSGNVKGSVFGGYKEGYNGDAASNSVTIIDGSIFDVYGGYSYSGNAASNSVNIIGGTVNQNVYGGFSKIGNSASNSINISGDTTKILGNIYGGVASDTGIAYENKVNIATGTLKIVYAGYSESGSVASNSVDISGDTTKIYEVYGGYVNSGTGSASYNILNISSGTLNVAYGGYANGTGDANENQVTMTGGEIVYNGSINNSGNLYGGYSNSGVAASNSVTISGGTVNREVYGGRSYSGVAASNSVIISGGNIGINVYGGYVDDGSGNASSNSVDISDGSIASVYGGWADSGDSTSNSVNISGGYVDYNVYGGYSDSGNSASNSVTISGDSTSIDNSVYGGASRSGDAVNNSVTIASGTVNNIVYGGNVIEGSGDAIHNSVIINDGTIGSVFGGNVIEGSGESASNSVTINDGIIGSVHGGNVVSGNGDVYGNSVTINGGKIDGYTYGGSVNTGTGDVFNNSVKINGGTTTNIYGGYSYSGNAASNSVNISGDTTNILGNIYGGFENGSGIAYENKVNIATGTLKIVYGGYSESGSVASNSVNISGDTTEINEVYGGYVEQGTGSASYNILNISSGTLNVAYGGYSNGSGDVASNSVNISDGTLNQNVFGGWSNFGNAASNSVDISGDTTNILGVIYGGVANGTGNAANNSVYISGGTVNKNVYGGKSSSNSSNNSVNISIGTVNGNVYGGSSNSGYVAINIVNISGGTVNGSINGGDTNSGDVASNNVNISGGTVNGPVFGGTSTASGKVASNSVNISSGTVNKSVYGGYTYSGNVVNNFVTISGGTFKDGSNIYGGYANNRQASSIVSGNIVNLTDSVTGFEGVNIFGYYFKSNSKKQTGNELHIGGTKTYDGEGNPVVSNGTTWKGKTANDSVNNKVKQIANFETIALHSVAWNDTLPALAAESFKYDNNTALGGNVTLDITSLTFDDDSLSGTMTLLQSDETDNFNGIKLKYSDSAAAAIPDEGQIVKNETAKSSTKGIEFTYDTKHSLSLSDSNKKINYTIANGYKKAELGSMKWSDGGHTFSDNDSIYPNGLEVSLGSDFNIEGSETKEDNSQITLLDLSQTSGIIKESVDSTKTVEIQKNASSEMTFKIAREDSIKSDQDKKKVIYTVGKSKDVTNVIFNSGINWNSENPYYSNTSFDFTNNKSIDASKLEFKFSNDQLAELSDSSKMTLISNATNQGQNVKVTYRDNGNNHTQQVDYSSSNGAVFSGTMTGTINTSNSSIEFAVSQNTLDSIDISNWDAEKEAAALLDCWSVNTNGVMITATDFNPTLTTGEKTILTASADVFKDENIDESIRYADGSFNNALENGVSHSGVQTGGVKASDDGKILTYYAMEKRINKFDLANWDGEKASSVNSSWKLAEGVSVETDGMSNLPDSDEEKQVFILKSDTESYFENVAINGENIYGKKQNKFTDSDESQSIVLSGTQDKGITLDSAKANLVYKVGSKDVTSLKLNSVLFEDGAELLNRDKYNYSKLTSLDTDAFNITFEKPETITVNQTMTLLNANDTLTDIAAVEKSNAYSYSPVSGVTMDAVILSRLEAKSGKVALTAFSNKADKLTFGDVEWKDEGSLIDHKTMLNNVSFDGADVDTTKIAFTNRQKLDADMQMTLVSDFGDSVGTITGDKYKVGTAYEGEGSAYLDGSDLKFKIKTGAGLSDETHTTVMSMDAGIAVLTAGSEQIGTAIEGLGNAANIAPDGTATFASVGGGSARYKTGSHVDTNSWNIALAVGKNLEKKDGTLEYGLFGEYGRGNYTLHMNGVEDAGSGNSRYTGGGLITKWTNSHGVYTEASFRLGNVKENTSNILHDGAGNGYGYDKKAKYKGGHIGFGKKYREDENTELEIYGKFFYNEREGINFAAGADQYSLDEVRSRILRAGFRLASTDRKWNRYGGIAYDHEFGGKSTGTVNGTAIRSASIKGGTIRGEFGIRREATKTNPWKTDISLYGFTGKRNGVGGSVAIEYQF